MSPITFNPKTVGPARLHAQRAKATSVGVYGQSAWRVRTPAPDAIYWDYADARLDGRYFTDHAVYWITEAVDRFMPDQGGILELMCGRYSYFTKRYGHAVHGMSLVSRPLKLNETLDSFVVRDLNKAPHFSSARTYRAALMTFGLPYLTQPLEVLQAVHQALETKARLIVVCADNCYDQQKATAIWDAPWEYRSAGRVFQDRKELTEDLVARAGFRVTHAHDLTSNLSYDFFMVVGEKISGSGGGI